MDNMINETEKLMYAIKIDGQPAGMPYPSKMIAEQAFAQLPQDVKERAKIVPVTEGGQELLLG